MSFEISADVDCPCCSTATHVKVKTLLVDAAWEKRDSVDAREANFASIRADDIKPEFLGPEPLQQFIQGYYCEKCDLGFLPNCYEKQDARHYYFRRNFSRQVTT